MYTYLDFLEGFCKNLNNQRDLILILLVVTTQEKHRRISGRHQVHIMYKQLHGCFAIFQLNGVAQMMRSKS